MMSWLWGIAYCLCGCIECSDHQKTPQNASAESPAVAVESPPAISDEKIQVLENLGYFERAATRNPEDRRVTRSAAGAYKGYSLYSSRHTAEAYLIDMAGEVVHTWSGKETRPGWMHVEMLPDGALLAIADYRYVAKLDWHSNVLWQRRLGAHHDLHVDSNGRIYVLTYSVERYPYAGNDIPIKDVNITVLSPSGKLLREHRLFPLLRKMVPKTRLALIARRVKGGSSVKSLIQENAPADVLHVNSLQILDNPIPNVAPAGSFLLSVRELNRIVILNPKLSKVLWEWGAGELQEQHHATLIENGNITVFDNGINRKQSRVIEISPATKTVVWSYTAPDFYSRLRGAAQKLPGGNVLITESDKGHVFEVNAKGKRVWEFWNPDIIGTKPPSRATIYRMNRYKFDYLNRSIAKAAKRTNPDSGGPT